MSKAHRHPLSLPLRPSILHHHHLLLILLLLVTTWHDVTVEGQCVPADNCKSPDCRCWDDPQVPGAFAQEDTPQIILVSFGYAVNAANEPLYSSLFEGLNNPNGCPTRGTFFVQDRDSDFTIIKELYDRKHEIGVTTASGTTPSSPTEWVTSLEEVKVKLEQSGIPPNQILGVRAPELFVGGNYQFDALEQNQLEYDSSCVSQVHTSPATMIWPYTYDFVDSTPKCSIGADPTKSYKGKWQFIVADLKVGDQKCATPSACSPFINSTQEAFDMLFNSFGDHFEGKRSPFILYVDPLWLTNENQRQGTKQFLEFVRAGFEDTWVITNQQALAWIKDPTPTSKIDDFDPWKCPS